MVAACGVPERQLGGGGVPRFTGHASGGGAAKVGLALALSRRLVPARAWLMAAALLTLAPDSRLPVSRAASYTVAPAT